MMLYRFASRSRIGARLVILLCSVLAAVAVCSVRAQLHEVKVVLVGDSTVATEGGWGPGFCTHLKPSIACLDLAGNGRSTKSFIEEGLWAKALEEHGAFYFIQFGHNDQKDPPSLHTDPETTFKTNLSRYIRDVRRIGGVPVIVTPLSRRNYKGRELVIDPLQKYAEAALDVAERDQVEFIDLYMISVGMLTKLSQEEADRFDSTAHKDARAEGSTGRDPDRTHLNDLGKQVFGDVIAAEVERKIPNLRKYLKR